MYASQQIGFKDSRIISAFHFPEKQAMNVTQPTAVCPASILRRATFITHLKKCKL
jgi:hypothetical protein